MLKSEILPKLAPQGPKRAFCAHFLENVLFSSFGDDLRPVGRFEIWCAQKWDLPNLAPHVHARTFCALFIEIAQFSRFDDHLRFDHFFLWEVLKREWQVCPNVKWDFENNCYAQPQSWVLCTFHRNRTVFTIRRWFESSATIFRSGVLKSEILRKLAPTCPKRANCALFLEIERFQDSSMLWGQ